MTAIDHHRGNARILQQHQIEDRLPMHPTSAVPLYLNDVLALADSMTVAGFDPGETVAKIDAIQRAVSEATSGDSGRWLSAESLLSMPPAEVAERVRQAGIDRATYVEQQNMRNGMDSSLARAAANAMAEGSDAVITVMRERFDPAVKVVEKAAGLGLTQFTEVASLLDTADAKVIAAYRALAPAVAELNSVMGLRNQMTSILRVGPVDHPMAAFITQVPTVLDLEGAQNVWRGETEVVQVETGFLGTHLAKIRAKQLGGGWLALVCGGYKLRLNTGLEAHQVVAAAHAGGAA